MRHCRTINDCMLQMGLFMPNAKVPTSHEVQHGVTTKALPSRDIPLRVLSNSRWQLNEGATELLYTHLKGVCVGRREGDKTRDAHSRYIGQPSSHISPAGGCRSMSCSSSRVEQRDWLRACSRESALKSATRSMTGFSPPSTIFLSSADTFFRFLPTQL